MRTWPTILAAAAVLAALPAAAPAATVSGVYSPEYCDFKTSCTPPRLTVTFTAAPGEANRLTARIERGGTVGIEDAGAPLRPEGACTARSEHAVVCPPPADVVAVLGDGDDVATVEPRSRLNGGDGADTLTGGSSHDVLSGGPGSDTVHGGGNSDLLLDDDPLLVADVYDGGAGDADVLSYAGRTTPVAVDLADPSPEGAAGEGDRVLGVEGAKGGAGADRLAGTAGPNRLDGNGGADSLAGRGGNDELLGGGGDTAGDRVDAGPGDDSVHGGPGTDTLDLGSGDDFVDPSRGPDDITAGSGDDQVALGSRGHRRSRVRCGPGADKLDHARFNLAPTLGDDCEVVLPHGVFDRSGERLRLAPQVRRVREAPARFWVGRSLPSEPGREYLRLELRLVEPGRPRSRERVIGAAQRSWRRGRPMRFAVPLRASGRRLLAARRRLDVRLVADRRRGGPPEDRSGVRFTLRLRR